MKALLLLGVLATAACHSNDVTCAAFCLTSASCSADGQSTWGGDYIASEGPTAAAAYGKLHAICPQLGTGLVAQARCVGSTLEIAPATITTVCAATPR